VLSRACLAPTPTHPPTQQLLQPLRQVLWSTTPSLHRPWEPGAAGALQVATVTLMVTVSP
jgi:hypothetical protein